MAINLVKAGESVVLDKGLSHVTVGLKWGGGTAKPKGILGTLFGGGGSSKAIDVDSSVALYDANNRLVNTIYYARPIGQGIKHAGDDRSGNKKYGKEDNEEIYVDLTQLDPSVTKLYVVANIFSGAYDFTDPALEGSYMRLTNTDNREELVRFNLDRYKGMAGLILGMVYKEWNGGWKFKAIGEGVRSSNLSTIINSIKH